MDNKTVRMVLQIDEEIAAIINERGGRKGKAEFVELCVSAYVEGNNGGLLERIDKKLDRVIAKG